jgi:hypothetical protein
MVKLHIYLSIIILSAFLFSCKQIYDPDINADQDALVVEGLITDSATAYTVHLTKALPYDSSGSYPAVTGARVIIYDDCDHSYELTESGSGYYYTDPAQLIGQPGTSYTLHIETKDGDIYESTPQLMYPDEFADSVYAEFTTQETLVENSDGESTTEVTSGVDLLFDIKNSSETLPRFRFVVKVTSEYEYSIEVSAMETDDYYCWESYNPNSVVNLTEEQYTTSSTDITGHSAGFIPTYRTRTVYVDDTSYTAYYINRIIRVTRYRVNQEAYEYYQNINTVLSAEGKIFDPVATQFTGNITCTNNSGKLALGFFEASPVHTSTYYIKVGSDVVHSTANVTIPPDGHTYTIPDFWIP